MSANTILNDSSPGIKPCFTFLVILLLCLLAWLPVHLMDDEQPFQRQHGVDFPNCSGFRANQAGHAPCRHYADFSLGYGYQPIVDQFGLHHLHDMIDLANETVNKSRLDTRHHRPADDMAGLGDFHPGQFGSLFEKGFGGNLDAGAYDTAKIVISLTDGTKCCGGAEINNDDRSAVEFECGHRIHD